jgi:hypothetical protein
LLNTIGILFKGSIVNKKARPAFFQTGKKPDELVVIPSFASSV